MLCFVCIVMRGAVGARLWEFIICSGVCACTEML